MDEIIVGDLLTIKEERYIVLELLEYNGDKYSFVNKISNDDNATEDFYILKILEKNVSFVVDDNLKNILLPSFQKMLKKDLEKILVE